MSDADAAGNSEWKPQGHPKAVLKSGLKPIGKSEGDSIEEPFAAKRINTLTSPLWPTSETVYYVGPEEGHRASTVSPSLVRTLATRDPLPDPTQIIGVPPAPMGIRSLQVEALRMEGNLPRFQFLKKSPSPSAPWSVET